MKDMIFQKRFENAVDTTLASLDPSAQECNQIIEKAMEGRKVKKIYFTAKPIFIFVMILLMMTTTALAAGIIFAAALFVVYLAAGKRIASKSVSGGMI